MVRKRIVFYGEVQGVGFRYRARCAAEHFGCTGRIRNEWDGSVVMEIQGDETRIEQVILSIERGRYIHITGTETHILPLKAGEHGFDAE